MTIAARVASAGGVVALALQGGGCVAYHVAAAPIKLAATTVVTTGEVAGAAVNATGKIAVSAFNAAGNVGGGSVDAASRLTQTGMVTFVDVAHGTIVRVPWQQGLTVASASAAAKVELARHAIDVVRAGAVVYTAARGASPRTELAAGDVVRLRG